MVHFRGAARLRWSPRYFSLLPRRRLRAAGLAGRPQVADALAILDLWLREQIETGAAPGLSVAVVRDQDVIWSGGYGLADLASRRPATPSTLYRIGSVSKLFTATAVMQLRDAGKLALDDPVAKYLPEFQVKNPFPARRRSPCATCSPRPRV